MQSLTDTTVNFLGHDSRSPAAIRSRYVSNSEQAFTTELNRSLEDESFLSVRSLLAVWRCSQ
jgi:hypothetical protein